MTDMPRDLPSAMVELGQLVRDDRLVYGLATVAVVLVVAGVLTALILGAWTRR